MSAARWHAMTESAFPWERDALQFVRAGLPDQEPFRAWSNFEFISDDGRVHEVDLLVLTTKGLFLVEIKSRPGELDARPHTWVWREGASQLETDNPLILANRKARLLAGRLARQAAYARGRAPFIEPLIFASAPGLKMHLDRPLESSVFDRDRLDVAGARVGPGILAALTDRAVGPPGEAPGRIDSTAARTLARALEQAGIRPSNRARRVSDYQLGRLLFEGPGYQDYEARHVSLGTRRRVRLYPIPIGAPAETRVAIGRAAAREFQILEGIRHPGILHADDYRETERGPALIFAHDPDALRLDHFLARHHARLDAGQRVALLRQIAEALQYAHGRRLIHRALGPQSILVSAPDSAAPAIEIFNWQTGAREAATTTALPTVLRPTTHLEQLVEDASLVYLAPETFTREAPPGPVQDVFSLGAMAYCLFSGRAPADSLLDLNEKLRRTRGLQIAEAVDGVGERLRELIQEATRPEVSSRLQSVDEFLVFLQDVEDELTRPDEPAEAGAAEVSPADANAGDRLRGGFVVKRRLGRGSTSVALLVEREGRELVLKVASAPEHNDRLRQEADVLRRLRHQHIVALHDELEIGGLTALLMDKAGDTTLAERLRSDGKLQVELLERFGEDLLTTVDWLDQSGVSHRDIKPQNIGVTPLGRGDRLHLVLFDFTLSRTPPANIRAGTVPYLDPFLSLRRPPAWDLNAERFAAAMTLYEMATGTLPRWGDGLSDPAVLDCEATIESDLVDPALRDALAAFFARAISRDAGSRFDNADEMLRAWRDAFARTDLGVAPGEDGEWTADLERAVAGASIDMPLVALGLGARALNALDRLGVTDVGGLLRLPLGRVYAMPGVGHKTRREVVDVATRLGRRFPGVFKEPEKGAAPEAETETDAVQGLDLLVQRLLPKRPAARGGSSEERALRALLGLDEASPAEARIWPSQTEVAQRLKLTRARVSQLVARARERWAKDPSFTRLRHDIVRVLDVHAAVLSAEELSAALLTLRGSVQDEPLRTRHALAVARAAVETEASRREPRFLVRRSGTRRLVARSEDWADYAERLGRLADTLAVQDPLASPTRIVETLQRIDPPDQGRVPHRARLVRLAAAASERAAASSRLELYPRGMPALRALRLAQGLVPGTREITVEQIGARVASRYPQAEPLPGRPALDALLGEAGWELEWQAEAGEGRGAYRSRRSPAIELPSVTSALTRYDTGTPAAPMLPAEVAEARQFEDRLRHAAEHGQFLVLSVSPRDLRLAEEELTTRFPVEARSVERLLIDSMKAAAQEAGADWAVVRRADRAPADSVDWQRLQALVRLAVPKMEGAIAGAERTQLLLYPGLLARYGQLGLFGALRDRLGRPGGPHGVWVLVPADEQAALPTIDGHAIPVITPGEWARIPEPWLRNAHRAAKG